MFDVYDAIPATILTYDFPGMVELIGFDIDEILHKLSQLFPSLFVAEYFFGYLASLAFKIEGVSYFILLGLPLLLIGRLLIHAIYLKPVDIPRDQRRWYVRFVSSLRLWLYHQPKPIVTAEDKFTPLREDSKQLNIFKGKILPKLQFVVDKVVKFWRFGNGAWHSLLFLVWSINLNVASIAISALAAYFYILATFEISALFFQLAKLLVDVLVMLASAPLIVWICIGYRTLEYTRKYIGDRRLYGHEAANREFIDELPLSSLVTGWMAAGKTALITDMGLTSEAMMRDKALDLLFEIDLQFPDFPWRAVEQVVDYGMRFGALPSEAGNEEFPGLRSLVTVRDFFNALRRYYNAHPLPDECFGYDAQRLKCMSDNGLVVLNIFDAMVVYAQLYYIYQIDTSLLVSSYAVRGGVKRIDSGHFPLFKVDFFDGKSFYKVGSGDQMSHVIDYDMFRLSKQVDHRNPNVGIFEFGVGLMSEKGKERGNMVENQGIKKDALEANAKNDGFDKDLKMRRHAATVWFYCFCKFFSDEQRPESVGANEREVSQIIHMDGVHKEGVFCPFFTLTGALADVIRASFKDFYYQYRNVRDDQTLLIYYLKHFVGAFYGYVDRKRNRYGYKIMKLRLEDGTGGEARTRFYTISMQKLYSGRYSTDCLKGIYVDQIRNCKKSLADLDTYQDIVASPEELKKQNSYFVNDVFKE